MFYHVGNCQNIDLKWHTLNLLLELLFKLKKNVRVDILCYDYIIDHWIFYSVWFLIEKLWLQNYSGRYDMWKLQWNWLITADNCKQM